MSQLDSDDKVIDPVLQWVTYQLHDEIYGVNVIQVQEVLRVTDITPVPGAPDYVLGIINLRGSVVTVVDTRRRFGLMSKETDDYTRIIVLEVNNNVIGMLVDSVSEVVYLHQSEIDTAPTVSGENNSQFILGINQHQQHGLLILVDVNKLLDDGSSEQDDLF